MEIRPSFIDRMITASLYTQFHDLSDLESHRPQGWEKNIASILDPIFTALSSTYREKKAVLSNRIMMKAEARQKFFQVTETADRVLRQTEAPKAPPEEDKMTAKWINAHPEISLREIGFIDITQLEDFLKEEGHALTCLNLQGLLVDDFEFWRLIRQCPHLRHLAISSVDLTDESLEDLEDLPLESVDFSYCPRLTDYALVHLQGMKLKSVNFNGCTNLTDVAFYPSVACPWNISILVIATN